MELHGRNLQVIPCAGSLNGQARIEYLLRIYQGPSHILQTVWIEIKQYQFPPCNELIGERKLRLRK